MAQDLIKNLSVIWLHNLENLLLGPAHIVREKVMMELIGFCTLCLQIEELHGMNIERRAHEKGVFNEGILSIFQKASFKNKLYTFNHIWIQSKWLSYILRKHLLTSEKYHQKENQKQEDNFANLKIWVHAFWEIIPVWKIVRTIT